MNDATKDQLRDLPNSAYGQALKIYLEEEVDKLKDISSVDCPPEEMAVQVLGRKEAIEILKNVMAITIPQPKPISRNQYK